MLVTGLVPLGLRAPRVKETASMVEHGTQSYGRNGR
jgi:hypothetical protein